MQSTAAARYIYRGTNDKSARKLKPEPKFNPQHNPLFLLLTPKGDYNANTLTGGEAKVVYGDDIFNKRGKYAHHANVFAGELLSHGGGSAVIKRLRPKVNVGTPEERDANISNVGLYLVTTDEMAEKPYLRDSVTGKVLRDENNNLRKDENAGDIQVRKVAVVAGRVDDVTAFNSFEKTIDGVNYKFTPLYIIPAEAHGSYYDNIGFGLEPMIGDATDKLLKDNSQALRYVFKLYDKSTGTMETLKTIMGSEEVNFALKPMVTDPITNAGIELVDLVPSQYGNMTDPALPMQGYTLGELVVGDDIALEGKLVELLTTEINSDTDGFKTYVDYDKSEGDVATVAEKYAYMVNILTCKYTSEVEYEAVRPIEITPAMVAGLKEKGLKVVTGNKAVPTYLEGGEDGDVTNRDHYEQLVVNAMREYMDPYSPVQNLAKNDERVFYDSGFKYENKLALSMFIGKRPDTFVVFSTYTFDKNNKNYDLNTNIGIAVGIQSNVRLYPESVFFNTQTARAAIVMGDAKLADGSYRYRLPLSLDYAIKMQKFMGALNGKWNGTYEFSTQPQNLINTMVDVNPKDIPDPVKDKMWTSGIIWAENDDKLTYFWTNHQTVYPDDTSVLNTVPVAIALGTVVRAGAHAWRKFSGDNNISDNELALGVEASVREDLAGAFNDQIMVIPEVTYTERDKLKGYSWHLENKVYAYNMKTVMDMHTSTFRMSDLANN
jgi:hypothetical protein